MFRNHCCSVSLLNNHTRKEKQRNKTKNKIKKNVLAKNEISNKVHKWKYTLHKQLFLIEFSSTDNFLHQKNFFEASKLTIKWKANVIRHCILSFLRRVIQTFKIWLNIYLRTSTYDWDFTYINNLKLSRMK